MLELDAQCFKKKIQRFSHGKNNLENVEGFRRQSRMKMTECSLNKSLWHRSILNNSGYLKKKTYLYERLDRLSWTLVFNYFDVEEPNTAMKFTKRVLIANVTILNDVFPKCLFRWKIGKTWLNCLKVFKYFETWSIEKWLQSFYFKNALIIIWT